MGKDQLHCQASESSEKGVGVSGPWLVLEKPSVVG